jgi:hypothetical protein
MPTDEVKSMHIAVYALSLLGGAHQKVHTEDVAQKCMEIAPERFKWEKYNYPDKELVRKALFHASEAKNGSFVAGRTGIDQRGKSRDGWQLSPSGAAWFRANEALLAAVLRPQVGPEVLPKREADRLLRRIRSEQAYGIFVRSGDVAGISSYMFTDLLNCSPDAAPETIRTKFQRLLSNAELLGDVSVLKFLRACEKRFSNLMSPATAVGGSE